jgi:hypothetical protein
MAPRLASQAMGLPSKSTTTWEAYAAGSGDTSWAQQLGTSSVTLSRRGYTLDREGTLRVGGGAWWRPVRFLRPLKSLAHAS